MIQIGLNYIVNNSVKVKVLNITKRYIEVEMNNSIEKLTWNNSFIECWCCYSMNIEDMLKEMVKAENPTERYCYYKEIMRILELDYEFKG